MDKIQPGKHPGNPSTTTISTIAVQSGNTRVVIALLQSGDWLELKVLELTPAITLLGATLKEATDLQRAHHEVLLKIQSKQSPVEELLRQADQLISDQKPRAEVYAAMADSLALAWRDVNSQLQKRKDILDYNVNYHSNASVCLERMRALELACRGAPLPIEVPAIRELLNRLNDVRRAMLESLMAALQNGRALLDILQDVAQEGTLDSRPDQIRTAANCAVSQVEHWLESLHDRRRLLEVSFQERKTQLEQCLAIALLTTDLRELENILEDKKESLNCSRDQLGDSEASSQLLLSEHRKLIPEAKELQEQGLKILKATEDLAATGHFAGEEAISQAYHLLNSATEYIEAIDQRDELINKTISFFRSAHITLTKLVQLEVQLNSTELPQSKLLSLHSSIVNSIEDVTNGSLNEGYGILEEVPGAEDVKRKVEEIENLKLQLNVKCEAFSEKRILASKALNDFLEKQNQLYSWLVSHAEAFIQGHQDMGSVLAMAKDFYQLHCRLLNELLLKGSEINALLLNVPATLEKLDEGSKSEVQYKADELQQHWENLKSILEKRSELARNYVKFHSLAVDLANELDELDNALLSTNKNEATLKQLEQKWITAQQLHMQLVNCGDNFMNDSQQVGDPYLDVERARLCVSTLTEHFTSRKNTTANRWKDWEIVINQNRQTSILWDRNMADTNKTVDWISRLDAQLYPILNEESSNAKAITNELELRLSTVLPEVKRAQTEIQLRIKTAEDLIGKGEITNRDDTVIVKLKELQFRLQTIITDYQVLLEMLISFFKNLSELEKTIDDLEIEYRLAQRINNLEDVERLLNEHDASRQTVLELFKFTQNESQQIINKIKLQEPEHCKERDIWTVKRILEEKRTAWERAWTDRRLKYEQMQQLSQFDSDLLQIHENINQSEQQLMAVRGQYGDNLSSAKSKSLAFVYFEKTIQLLEQRIETFVSAAEAMLKADNTRAPHIQDNVTRLKRRWEEFQKQVIESRRLIDLSIEFFTLVEEAEEWFKEGSRLLITITRRSSTIRTPEEATELLNELQTILIPGETKQDERIDKITVLADKIFGTAEGPSQLAQVKAENKEMKDSFSLVRQELKTLAEKLEIQVQQKALQDQQRKMDIEFAEKNVNVSTNVTEIIETSTSHQFVQENKEAHYKSPSPPLKKPKLKEFIDNEKSEPIKNNVAPNFIVPLVENTVIDEGDKFKFECRVTGVPLPEISWLKDGISIQNNPDYQTSYDDGLCSLTIEETFTEDSAKFTCRAENEAGVAETNCRLSVNECEPEEQMIGPTFIQHLSPLKLCEGSPAILSCKVDGNPLPTVQWFKDDICIDNHSDYSITYNNGDAVLKIEKTSLADQAEFSCKAVNKIGTDTTSATLTIEHSKEPEKKSPVFIVPLSNIMARTGQKIKLECEISGEPAPQITWLFNDKPIKEIRESKITFEAGKAVMVINEAFLKDSGTYSVHAENSAGEATVSCQVTVKGRLPTETSDSELASDMEPIKPSVQLQLKDSAVFEGMKVRLDCVIVGQPEPEVIWFHDGRPVKESDDFQLLFHGDRCSLIIKEAYLEDSGEYKVVALNSAGETSSKCNLTVQSVSGVNEFATREGTKTTVIKKEVVEINEYSPKFTQLLTDVLVPVGEDTLLQCSVQGSPPPTISWLHNNKVIEESERIKWEKSDDGVCTLNIPNVHTEDKGNYICRAQNSLGEAKCFAHLIVKGTVDQTDEDQLIKVDDNKIQPSFTELFADRSVKAGEPTKFECIVIGKPTPKVRWFFNDAPVSGKDFLVSTSGQRQVLSIPAVSENNVGVISCVAENEGGKATCVAKLKISDAPVDLLFPALEDIKLSETPGGFEMKRSIFTQSTTSKKEVFSSSSSSNTTVKGSSEPHVQVQSVTSQSELASQKIGEKPPVQVEHHKTLEYHYEDGVETQQKTELKSKTVGTDKESETTKTAIVPVRQRKQIPPRFVQTIMGRIVDQGADVILEGIIESFPTATVKWTKNGKEIEERSGLLISWELNRARMCINKVTVNDAGKYTCTANNPAGTASCTADLVVKKSIFPPVMGRRLQAGTAVVGERVTMEIEVSGTPDPDVTWYKDGVPIPDSSSIFILRHHGNSYYLLIEKANVNHTGQYSVRAVNSGGETKCTADFIVLESPQKSEINETLYKDHLVIESVFKDSEEKKKTKTPSVSTLPSQTKLFDSQIKKESEKLNGSCIITETVKTDKHVSIKLSHSPLDIASTKEKSEYSSFHEEEKSSSTPVPLIESPLPPQAYKIDDKIEKKPETFEIKHDSQFDESINTLEKSDTEDSESHVSKKDALHFFKNIIKANKEEQERLPKKSEQPSDKPIVSSPLSHQPPIIDNKSQKEYFQSKESIVSDYKKEFCEIIDNGEQFNLEPGPPPEMGFIEKGSVATKKEELTERAKRLEETHRTLSNEEVPSGAVRIFPVPASKTKSTPSPSIQSTFSFPKFETESVKKSVKESAVEEFIIPEKNKQSGVDEKTYTPFKSPEFPKKESKLGPVFRPQADIALRPQSPRPSAEAVSMEKLWTVRPKETEDISKIIKSETSKKSENTYSKHETQKSSWNSIQSFKKSDYISSGKTISPIERPVSPPPSSEGVAMDKMWAHKHSESSLKTAWPPSVTSQIDQTIPSLENKKVDIVQQKPDLQVLEKETKESILKQDFSSDLVSQQSYSALQKETPLEPFPFRTEPARTQKRSVGPPPPSPAKFVKGDFRESDYESDYDGRIPVKWRPHDSDSEDVTFRPVHPVLSSPVSHKSKQSAPSPTPPSAFERPHQTTGFTRSEPIEKTKKSSVKIQDITKKSVVKPKPIPAQQSPPIEIIVATPALDFDLKPGSPPKMDYAPPPPNFRIPHGTQMETSNTMNFAEATENSRRVVSMQQTTRVIKFDESKTKKSKFTAFNKSQESDYESDYDTWKLKKSQKPLPITQSSHSEYQAAEQKRLQRVEEMRRRFSNVEPTAVEPVLTPGEPPQFGFIEPKIPAAAATIANKHISEMTESFKTKAQRFASDVVTDIKSVPKQNGISSDKSLSNNDDAQAYREESRLSEYGTKHIDPDTGLIYFKYDFGYEFGVVLPGEGGKTTKTVKKQIDKNSSSKEEGSIEVPVIHETTKKQTTKSEEKKQANKTVKWEQTSESEMSDIDASPGGGSEASAPHCSSPLVVNASETPEHSRKAPMFITPLRDIAVLKGQIARFECIVQAEPLPNILWTKDGRILQESEQHNIQFRNGVCRLTLQNSNPNDAGIYKCTATNLLGTTECSSTLEVSGERRPLH